MPFFASIYLSITNFNHHPIFTSNPWFTHPNPTLIPNPNHPDLLSMTSLPVLLLQLVSLAHANFTVKWLSLATSAPSQQKTRELKVSVLVFGRVLWGSLTFGPLAVHIDTQYGCGTEESHQQCSADQSWQRHDDHRRATGGHRPIFEGDNHQQG